MFAYLDDLLFFFLAAKLLLVKRGGNTFNSINILQDFFSRDLVQGVLCLEGNDTLSSSSSSVLSRVD